MVTRSVTQFYIALLILTAWRRDVRSSWIRPIGETPMFKHIILHITCLLILLCIYGAQMAARGQGVPGEIRGTVADPSGAFIPSAQILLKPANGSSRTV